jgi:hypothetical protein
VVEARALCGLTRADARPGEPIGTEIDTAR